MVDKKSIILLILVVVIIAFPLAFYNGKSGYFSGSDDQGSTAIEATGYHPWIQPLWTPPSSEIESLLFSIQTGIGAIIIGYIFGYYNGQAKERKKREKEGITKKESEIVNNGR
jgi:cobalt/nickel transport protein